MRNFFNGLPAQRKRAKLGAFDSETFGLNGRLLIITACYEKASGAISETLVFDKPKEFIAWILADKERQKVIWYAHNAEYDWRYLIEAMIEYTEEYNIVPAMRAERTVYQICFYQGKKKCLTMRDSMAIFPFSLAQFAAKFSTKPKLDIGLSEGVIFDVNNPDHMKYAKNDSETLLECLINYNNMIMEHFEVAVKGTVASTSYNGFLRTIGKEEYYRRVSPKAEAFMRKSYYGGIVYIKEVNKVYDRVATFDINSSYPYCMEAFGVPYGDCIYTRTYDDTKPGFWRCRVSTNNKPVASFHFIPFREKFSLVWARGDFETYISSIELEEAKRNGYEIRVIEGYTFDKIVFPFAKFVGRCRSIRQEYKGQPLETVAKLMQNSLYGKFGMAVGGIEYKLSGDCPDDMTTTYDNDNQLIKYLWNKKVQREAPYMLPHWSAWITANARLRLLLFMQIVGFDNFLYADTDSVTCNMIGRERLIASGLVGNEYGQVKDEGLKFDWLCFGPKCYVYKSEDEVYKGKIKGIPKKLQTSDYLQRVWSGDRSPVEFTSTHNLLRSIETHKLESVQRRSPTDFHNLQGWNIIGTFAVPKSKFVEHDSELSYHQEYGQDDLHE